MATTMYGIANCDTIKKAKKWLNEQQIDFDFHDVKKLGVNDTLLREWVEQVGWQVLLNKRGMMWRKLSEDARKNIDEASAIAIMLETPSIIKRPVLVCDTQLTVGFDVERYQSIFLKSAG